LAGSAGRLVATRLTFRTIARRVPPSAWIARGTVTPGGLTISNGLAAPGSGIENNGSLIVSSSILTRIKTLSGNNASKMTAASTTTARYRSAAAPFDWFAQDTDGNV
jgi:hypothetical protein